MVEFSHDPFAVVIVTPLMKRAHRLATSKTIVFVDSTSACDAENYTITFVLCTCAAGAAPLCVIITKGKSQQSYVAGFNLLRNFVKKIALMAKVIRKFL